MPKIGFQIELVGSASSATKAFTQTEASASRMSTAFSKIGSAAKSAFLPVTAFGVLSVKAYGESETALAGLQTAMSHNPDLAGQSTKAFEALAKEIQSKTRADDESVISGAAVLANFKLTGKQIQGVLPLVVDYARRTGKDVPTAAGVVGKALLGNTRALKDIGIKYTSTGDAGKDFANIQDLLASKVGGFAEREGKTTLGQLDIMKNQFNDLQEVVGGKVVGAFNFLSRNMEVVGPILAAIVGGFVAFKVATIAATLVTAIFGQTAGAAWIAAAGPVGLVVAAVVGLGVVIYTFRDQIIGALMVVKDFFVNIFTSIRDFLGAWGPVVLAIMTGGISLLVSFFIDHFTQIKDIAVAIWNGIKSFLSGVWTGIRTTASTVWNGIKLVIETPLRAIQSFISATMGLIAMSWSAAWNGIKGVVVGVWNGITGAVRSAVNFLIGIVEGAINFIIGAYNKLADLPFNPMGHVSPVHIPRLAAGGRVVGPGAVMVGEHGREILNLPVGAQVEPLGRATGGGGTSVFAPSITVEGHVMTERDLMDLVRKVLIEFRDQNGRTGLEAA